MPPVRIMREEMRHGVQMSYLLVKFFGASGKLEAPISPFSS